MKLSQCILLLLFLLLLSNCTESPTQVKDDNSNDIVKKYSSKIKIVSSIDIGGKDTRFDFKISPKNPEDLSLIEGREIRWDFDSDGIYETDWAVSDSISKVFSNIDKHQITANVKLAEDTILVSSTIVYTEPVENLLSDTTYFVHEMCYSYDEQNIYFAWGSYPHQIYKIDKNGGPIEGVTTNLASDDCRHFPVASPNGKYLAYSYNGGLDLFSLESKTENQIASVYTFCTNTFTSDSKYFLTNDGSCNEIHLINVLTGTDSLLLTNAHEAAVVPQKNEIAYLRYTESPDTISEVDLVFYDLKTKQNVKVYNNIPFPYRSPFQIIEGSKAIYFTEAHILYYLESGNSYKIDTDESKKYFSWPSTISQNGNNVLFSTGKGMIRVTLPSDLE